MYIAFRVHVKRGSFASDKAKDVAIYRKIYLFKNKMVR